MSFDRELDFGGTRVTHLFVFLLSDIIRIPEYLRFCT